MVPGRRKGELTVRRDDDVGYKVVMALENTFWVAIGDIVSCELPDNDCFVYMTEVLESKNLAWIVQVPLEAVRIISGFSDEVAMAVTHPL